MTASNQDQEGLRIAQDTWKVAPAAIAFIEPRVQAMAPFKGLSCDVVLGESTTGNRTGRVQLNQPRTDILAIRAIVIKSSPEEEAASPIIYALPNAIYDSRGWRCDGETLPLHTQTTLSAAAAFIRLGTPEAKERARALLAENLPDEGYGDYVVRPGQEWFTRERALVHTDHEERLVFQFGWAFYWYTQRMGIQKDRRSAANAAKRALKWLAEFRNERGKPA